jgi:hypothetical protein
MACPFPRWSDTAIRVALVLGLLGASAAIATPMIYVRTPYNRDQLFPVDQPVLFDHRHHAGDDGIDCRYCHATVEHAASAGMPATEVCAGCHNQIWNASEMLEPVRRSYFSGLPIPWNRVYELPDFVYFNHSVHIAKGIGCVSCHGRVDQMARVYQATPLTMGWCLDCHRDPEPHLRPREEVTVMDWRAPGDPAAYGAALAAKSGGVRHLTHCTACHR